MEIFAGLSVGVLILAALVVAIKTFGLWLRTRGLPELLLGVMLVSATVLGYPLAIASSQIVAASTWPVHLGSQVLFSLGYACLLLFTRRVFRAREAWAAWLVGLTVLVLVGTCAVYLVEALREDPRRPMDVPGLTLVTTLPVAVAYFWTTFESLRYYRRLRLRLRLGLAEVAVTNRFLLWGLMTLSAGIAVVINVGGLLAGAFMSPAIVLVSSSLGLVHASCLFLAFHPPRWYHVWLEGRAASEGR